MPMHDWKRVPATIYHHFHQQWTISICNALNAGLLPTGYSALVEQYSSGLYPDVLAVQQLNRKPSSTRIQTTNLEAPRTRLTVHPREGRFHKRANRVVICHHLDDVVCAIDVVSPGNKAGKIAVREFVAKAVDFLRRGINLLVVDPFPPGPQAPIRCTNSSGTSLTRVCRSNFPPTSRSCSPPTVRPRHWWNSPRRRLSNRSAWGPSCPTCLPGWTSICT
jgi:hypothetical protein